MDHRHWTYGQADTGAIHALGNGKLLAYSQGPDIIQLFGPPYTSGSALELRLTVPLSVISTREKGRAIWHHKIMASGAPLATFVDFVDSNLPCFIRNVETSIPITLTLSVPVGVTVRPYPAVLGGGLVITVPAGHPVYGHYPSHNQATYRVQWSPLSEVDVTQASNSTTLQIGPGVTTLKISGGPLYPEAIAVSDAAASLDFESALSRTRCWWDEYSTSHTGIIQALPDDTPFKDTLAWAIDGVAVLMKAQQAIEGGVMAGYPYHLAYVRDQYGCLRGFLALGHHADAKAILDFYRHTFQSNGCIRNAQAVGVPGLFHVHEHDESEITGYLILGAFDYIRATGSQTYLDEIWPLLDWAWNEQVKVIADDMLPFSGDETYIAGGVLPRAHLDDGAAEATLLFIHSGQMLVQAAEERGLWSAEQIRKAQSLLSKASANYPSNFIKDGVLVTNNPKRATLERLPRIRHGVCNGGHFGWTELAPDGMYYCPECLHGAYSEFDINSEKAQKIQAEKAKVYRLKSVGLAPRYFRSDLVPISATQPLLDGLVDGSVSVGYDLGLLLWNLHVLGHRDADKVYRLLLDIIDETAAWAEYYDKNNRPVGTRCRPWESAINIEACLAYIFGLHLTF